MANSVRNLIKRVQICQGICWIINLFAAEGAPDSACQTLLQSLLYNGVNVLEVFHTCDAQHL